MTRVTGWHVLLMTLGFFAVVIGANVTMVTFALNTFSGDDVEDAYGKGIAYNQTLALRSAETAAGFTAVVEVKRGPDATAGVRATIEEHGIKQAGLDVRVRLAHPSDAHKDREAVLDRAGDVYQGSVPDVATGNWDVIVTASRDGTVLLEARSKAWLP